MPRVSQHCWKVTEHGVSLFRKGRIIPPSLLVAESCVIRPTATARTNENNRTFRGGAADRPADGSVAYGSRDHGVALASGAANPCRHRKRGRLV